MKCKNCGFEFEQGEKFCTNCGAKLESYEGYVRKSRRYSIG